MAKTGGSAAERTELYRSIAEESERRKISYESVCEGRGVPYDTFLCFRFRQHRKGDGGIMVRRIPPKPKSTPEMDRIEISVSTQGRTMTISFQGHCSVETELEALRDVQA